ncbi:hypothetical protein DOY81_004290 [Sarcophaga bullata]|nr:hypothetical protein DOY81_004290 [Sarcophaga bullata]
MSGKDRIPIFPSRANLVLMKHRSASAQKGLNLLKRKRDALEMHLRQIAAELKMNRDQAEDVMREAIFSLAKARFWSTDFKPATVAHPDRADVHLRIKSNKIIGVTVPALELMMRPSSALNFTGLSSGGGQVQIIREKFQEALKILVAVASLEYSVKIIEEAVKQNKKRVNGLEYVVLPRYQNTAAYIRDELDEFEREDFYRLKRSQAKQQQKKSDFIKKLSERKEIKRKEAKDPGVDFGDTHLRTPAYEIIAPKPAVHYPKLRTYVSKVMERKVVLETEEAVPLNLEATYSKAVLREKEPKSKKKQQEEEESASEISSEEEIKHSDED